MVFYGDHLPGIYSSASADDDNSLALHLTDYFIWSNKASGSQGNEIDNADYSSPNFFVAQAAEHMDAKVFPVSGVPHAKCMPRSPPWSRRSSTTSKAGTVSLKVRTSISNAKGNPMAEDDFDAETKQLLADYKLIQYDITTGRIT